MISTTKRTRARLLTIAVLAAFAAPAAAQMYAPGDLIKVQAPQKGRQGPPQGSPGADRPDRRGPAPDYGRGAPPPDRRGQMSDDERRSLNQDLDKANRELYRRRFPQ